VRVTHRNAALDRPAGPPPSPGHARWPASNTPRAPRIKVRHSRNQQAYTRSAASTLAAAAATGPPSSSGSASAPRRHPHPPSASVRGRALVSRVHRQQRPKVQKRVAHHDVRKINEPPRTPRARRHARWTHTRRRAPARAGGRRCRSAPQLQRAGVRRGCQRARVHRRVQVCAEVALKVLDPRATRARTRQPRPPGPRASLVGATDSRTPQPTMCTHGSNAAAWRHRRLPPTARHRSATAPECVATESHASASATPTHVSVIHAPSRQAPSVRGPAPPAAASMSLTHPCVRAACPACGSTVLRGRRSTACAPLQHVVVAPTDPIDHRRHIRAASGAPPVRGPVPAHTRIGDPRSRHRIARVAHGVHASHAREVGRRLFPLTR
jgi:hypothetical protein